MNILPQKAAIHPNYRPLPEKSETTLHLYLRPSEVYEEPI